MSASGKGVSLKTKDVRGEGFSVRFTKRPNLGKKTEIAAEPEKPIAQEPKMTAGKRMTSRAPTLAETKLWVAARTGDCGTIRTLVMEGVDLEARDMDGRTAFNIATQYNQQNALKTLLAAREMKRLALLGDLPDTSFFRKFNETKTGTDKA